MKKQNRNVFAYVSKIYNNSGQPNLQQN